jgi:hypothetical protein
MTLWTEFLYFKKYIYGIGLFSQAKMFHIPDEPFTM